MEYSLNVPNIYQLSVRLAMLMSYKHYTYLGFLSIYLYLVANIAFATLA